jgi:HD-GYP domain-containing protein (c-di-GMP phosphodiesterase class II)
LIGYEIGIKQNDLLDLGYSAILHDTGKIFVDCKMLNKKNKLTKEEFENIKKHPSKGYTYLKNKYNFSKKILEGVLYHHERWNGEGYEAKISGDKIPNYAYIIAVADVFDALTTKRIYRNKWSINIALSYINKNSSVLFSPAVVESLNKITKHKPG